MQISDLKKLIYLNQSLHRVIILSNNVYKKGNPFEIKSSLCKIFINLQNTFFTFKIFV